MLLNSSKLEKVSFSSNKNVLKYKNKQNTRRMYCDQAGESQARLLLENTLVDYHI